MWAPPIRDFFPQISPLLVRAPLTTGFSPLSRRPVTSSPAAAATELPYLCMEPRAALSPVRGRMVPSLPARLLPGH
jgi:hypothetical protein